MAILFLSSSLNSFSQAPPPSRSPGMKDWDVWLGDWTLVGTARDGPSMPEYKVTWKLHERRILGGAFIQVEQVWRGSGPESRALEILSYDPVRNLPSSRGFSSDGSTWTATATFEGLKCTENGTAVAPDGKRSTFRAEFIFASDRQSLSGSQEIETDGVKWTGFKVRGTKTPRRQ